MVCALLSWNLEEASYSSLGDKTIYNLLYSAKCYKHKQLYLFRVIFPWRWRRLLLIVWNEARNCTVLYPT